MEIYTPNGKTGETPKLLSDPIPVLSGLSMGVLDNTKPNAGLLLNRLAERLTDRVGLKLALTETKNAALAAPDQVLETLSKEVQVVLTGSAD
ncbi:hypothetical protein CL649_02850 [bacterium]|nr:hypothetical protein [bacterium]